MPTMTIRIPGTTLTMTDLLYIGGGVAVMLLYVVYATALRGV